MHYFINAAHTDYNTDLGAFAGKLFTQPLKYIAAKNFLAVVKTNSELNTAAYDLTENGCH
jgi:hypothetical protein